MTTTINADNGAVSGSAGLKSSADATGVLALQTNGTTAVTVDASQRVGIGTASPATKLNISSAGADVEVRASTTTSGNVRFGFDADGAYYNWIQTNRSSGAIQFAISNSEVMRIDSSGNVGIGVTPSAWNTGKAIEVSSLGTALWSSSAGSASISGGAYFNSGWKYANATSKPSLIDIDNAGKISLLTTTATGTAGNAVSFTQVVAVEAGKSLALQGATSQTGAGITFPTVQSASTDANTLDDYEEGTWTPSVGGTATYSAQTGQYVKIGRQVTVFFDMSINVIGTGNTTLILGLPFSCSSTSTGQGGTLTYWSALTTSAVYIAIRVDNGASQIIFAGSTAATATLSASFSCLGSTSRMIGTMTYTAA